MLHGVPLGNSRMHCLRQSLVQDLKPHNILLGRHGEAKIGDVGFSRWGRAGQARQAMWMRVHWSTEQLVCMWRPDEQPRLIV